MPQRKKYILALDQGTSSSKAFLFDNSGQVLSRSCRDFRQIYPQPGWVEHSPEEIWQSQMSAATEAISLAGVKVEEISAIGITNQRETTILWDKTTGKPVFNAIVWQCRRTADRCARLKRDGFDKVIKERTGLVTDAYFSGTKVEWILDQIPGCRARAERGEILFGTVDSWLVYNLTRGRVHTTDYSNASRTLLFDIHRRCWDDEILKQLRIPAQILPAVSPSSQTVGETDASLFGARIPISGIAGDQQAALFGQTCFRAGQAKNTYGTGCFMLLNTGRQAVASRDLLTTIAWALDGQIDYALEGSVFIAGAAVQWLRDELGLIGSSGEIEALAASVPDTGGVYFVPAFVGLGAPYWDAYARGTIVGLTRGSGRAHLARATLEAIAYQTRDVLEAMKRDSSVTLEVLGVDGGAAVNDLLCQFQADILGVPVERPAVAETTALGAAYLAGLATGFWKSREEIERNHKVEKRYLPSMSSAQKDRLYRGWSRALERSREWEVIDE
ncbi:MAG TPA: glycerol kinase GlpK [Acidobacteriota bacterium]|nr:glycerol kinase GlpK [Acidobacteriota bacterium]